MELARKRVLLTGGAGFLGAHVAEELRVRDVGELIIPRRLEIDLTDPHATEKLFADTEPDIVIHLAAEVGGIAANRGNPGRFFYANMAMGLNVIERSRRAGVEKVVQIGTVCAYPKFTPVPFHEQDLWSGYPEETNAPYGVAKRALLTMLQAYRQQYGLNGIYLIPVNLYGPRDNFDLETGHVIPALIRKFVAARDDRTSEVVVWGSGDVSREFLYVSDAARGIVAATERYEGSEPVNLGTGQEVTIRELAETIARIVGFSGRLVWDRDKPDGQPRRRLDVTRARELFGFEAEVELEEGLRRTIAWWEANRVKR